MITTTYTITASIEQYEIMAAKYWRTPTISVIDLDWISVVTENPIGAVEYATNWFQKYVIQERLAIEYIEYNQSRIQKARSELEQEWIAAAASMVSLPTIAEDV